MDNWSAYYEEAKEILEEINLHKQKYFHCLEYKNYTKRIAVRVFPHVKKFYDLYMALMPIDKKYGRWAGVHDSYICSLADCYVAMEKYDEAEKLFKVGFAETPVDSIRTLYRSVCLYAEKIILKKDYERARFIVEKFIGNFPDEKKIWLEKTTAETFCEDMEVKSIQVQKKYLKKLIENFEGTNIIEIVNKLQILLKG